MRGGDVLDRDRSFHREHLCELSDRKPCRITRSFDLRVLCCWDVSIGHGLLVVHKLPNGNLPFSPWRIFIRSVRQLFGGKLPTSHGRKHL
jgi:hypothetical protein